MTFFGVEAGMERRAGDFFPTGSAPFIRLTREGTESGSQHASGQCRALADELGITMSVSRKANA